jgi:drug/metabolite transporter (DMT)-like permease
MYEVDNSHGGHIDVARPLVGSVCLLCGVAGSTASIIGLTELATRAQTSTYVAALPMTIGHAVLSALIFAAFAVRSSGEILPRRAMVWSQMIVAGVMFAMSRIAEQTAARVTGSSTPLALQCLHPSFMAAWGYVFNNPVFREEVVGSLVLTAGTFISGLPRDVSRHRWIDAEVLALSAAIYTLSTIFSVRRARATASTSLIVFVVATMWCIVQIAVALAHVGGKMPSAVWGEPWLIIGCSIGATVALYGYFLALKFLPPMGVSVSMVVGQHILVIWNINNDGRNGHTAMFIAGTSLAACAAAFLLYTVAVRRQRLEYIIESLARRKKPKHPYRRGQASVAVDPVSVQ